MIKSIVKFLLFITFVAIPLMVNAQMFSVGNEGESRNQNNSKFIKVGIGLNDFVFNGDPSVFNDRGTDPLSFNGNSVYLGIESNMLDISFMVGNQLTGIDNRNYLDLDIKFTFPFYLLNTPDWQIGIPVKIGNKITSVRSDTLTNNFSQTNIGAGAGGLIQYQKDDIIGFEIQVVPGIGFSTASGGFIGGSYYSLRGVLRITFIDLIFGKNIQLGYDYKYNTYNIDEEKFNYDLRGHMITIGVSL